MVELDTNLYGTMPDGSPKKVHAADLHDKNGDRSPYLWMKHTNSGYLEEIPDINLMVLAKHENRYEYLLTYEPHFL